MNTRRPLSRSSVPSPCSPGSPCCIAAACSRISAPVTDITNRDVVATFDLRIERRLHVVHLPLRLVNRRARSSVLALEDRIAGPLVIANQPEALDDRRVARPLLYVGAVIALP